MLSFDSIINSSIPQQKDDDDLQWSIANHLVTYMRVQVTWSCLCLFICYSIYNKDVASYVHLCYYAKTWSRSSEQSTTWFGCVGSVNLLIFWPKCQKINSIHYSVHPAFQKGGVLEEKKSC